MSHTFPDIASMLELEGAEDTEWQQEHQNGSR
jgi:hypothetical protein